MRNSGHQTYDIAWARFDFRPRDMNHQRAFSKSRCSRQQQPSRSIMLSPLLVILAILYQALSIERVGPILLGTLRAEVIYRPL